MKGTSILTPCYNGAGYIPQYLDNILGQTAPGMQVIFVNDGSTDETEQLILAAAERIRAKGYEFVYLKQDNQGVGSAINLALKHVNRPYLALLDMDDILLKDAILKREQYLDAHPACGMVLSNGRYMREDGRLGYPFAGRRGIKGNLFERMLDIRVPNWPGSYTIRSAFLFEIYPDREIYQSRNGQNLQLMMPVACYHETGYINECLMYYRLRRGSLSRPEDRQRLRQMVDGYQEIREHIIDRLRVDENHKEEYRKRSRKAHYRDLLREAVRTGNRDTARDALNALRPYRSYRISTVIYMMGATRPTRVLFRAMYKGYKHIKRRVY